MIRRRRRNADDARGVIDVNVDDVWAVLAEVAEEKGDDALAAKCSVMADKGDGIKPEAR